MKISRALWVFLSVIAAFLFQASPTRAQTDADLLAKPWQAGQVFDSATNSVIESSAPTREQPKTEVGLSSYEAMGRWRLFPDADATPRLGYDISYFNITTTDPALPRHLWDGTVGIAQPVANFNKWFVVLTAAAGYAGDTPFSDPHAAYFTANAIVGRKFSEDRAVILALNYDGNRTFFPDLPIPVVAYADRLNDHFTYVLGLPDSSVTYEPASGLQLDLGWELIDSFSGRVNWEFRKHCSVYSAYVDRTSPFHLSNLPDDRRLFLEEHRIELGFRYDPTQLIRLSIGGGWAFGQEFSTGFDIRGTNSLRHLRDGPFASALLEIGF